MTRLWSSLGSTSMRRAPVGPTSRATAPCPSAAASPDRPATPSRTRAPRRPAAAADSDDRRAATDSISGACSDVDLAPRADVHAGERRADGHQRQLARRRRQAPDRVRGDEPARRMRDDDDLAHRRRRRGQRVPQDLVELRAPRDRPSPTAPTRRRRSRPSASRAAAPPARPTPTRSRAGPARARTAARSPA